MNKLRKYIIYVVTCITLIAACSKDGTHDELDDIANDTPGHIPGMGGAGGELTGTPFQFPSSIELAGGIKGDLFLVPMDDYCQQRGSGAFVLVQLNLVNKLGKDTLLVLPAGLTFLSDDIEDQNGILIQETKIELLKGQSCKTLVYTFCINELRHGSSRSSSYTFGPVTNAKPMVDLIKLVKDKGINYEDVGRDQLWEIKHELQSAVWHITDGSGLTADDKDFINQLANR